MQGNTILCSVCIIYRPGSIGSCHLVDLMCSQPYVMPAEQIERIAWLCSHLHCCHRDTYYPGLPSNLESFFFTSWVFLLHRWLAFMPVQVCLRGRWLSSAWSRKRKRSSRRSCQAETGPSRIVWFDLHPETSRVRTPVHLVPVKPPNRNVPAKKKKKSLDIQRCKRFHPRFGSAFKMTDMSERCLLQIVSNRHFLLREGKSFFRLWVTFLTYLLSDAVKIHLWGLMLKSVVAQIWHIQQQP